MRGVHKRRGRVHKRAYDVNRLAFNARQHSGQYEQARLSFSIYTFRSAEPC